MFNKSRGPKIITEVSDYSGERVAHVSATQLGLVKASYATRVVAEWQEYLSSGPTAIEELHFTSRTPKRLFAALEGQTQLREIHVKWGDFEDLTPLTGMGNLEVLVLEGASSVRSLEPLTELTRVRELQIESLRYVSDLAPLARMTSVTSLTVGGDWTGPRNVHVDSIAFLRQMPS